MVQNQDVKNYFKTYSVVIIHYQWIFALRFCAAVLRFCGYLQIVYMRFTFGINF